MQYKETTQPTLRLGRWTAEGAIATHAAATVAASVLSQLSGHDSSPLLGVVGGVVPDCGPSNPEDWGPGGAEGVKVGVDVGGAVSAVC